MVRITLEDSSVCGFSIVVLVITLANLHKMRGQHTHIFLLLVYMTYLEPDVLLAKRARWVIDNVAEALRDC